ncbi:unnamed protein product [Pleuronectes platessa]|uniref:Uncharacterized protein n=1 Tax=Pleuronectes platessa TaxID=8262 RepID=A0A9N7TXU8_PLEPL|nr:unnamed protein product [Pleuronectes platessa]
MLTRQPPAPWLCAETGGITVSGGHEASSLTCLSSDEPPSAPDSVSKRRRLCFQDPVAAGGQRLQAPAVRAAAHLEERSGPGGGGRGEKRKEAPGASETKRVRPGTREEPGERREKRDHRSFALFFFLLSFLSISSSTPT